MEYTERVVRGCAAFLLAVYDEYVLWKVQPDLVKPTSQFGFAMEEVLGSCTNFHEMIELLDVIKSTLSSCLADIYGPKVHDVL